ncbi:helix-turn-helix domain-containing protein [Micromonospora sp. NPDC000663]|uniref:helix-turn-helix domain-containing protein n=1 Tax=Micromonospora sp. NPDC000663 TaxID=3364218 RepID=UPI003677A9DE
MDQSAELGSFLRTRRAALRPRDVVTTPIAGRRRVPGLRREELAQLAGVSVAYYTRLEQGRGRNVSDAVLDAIARALRLNETERSHLHDLARITREPPAYPRPERLRPQLQSMVEAISDVPAYVVDRYADVLAWNSPAHALLAGHVDFDAPYGCADRPNLQRLLFLDPRTRLLYRDWSSRTRVAVGCLRRMASRYPGDRRLGELVGELTSRSPEFSALWSSHPVLQCGFSTESYRHPVVGEITLRHEVMDLPGDAGQQFVMVTAEPETPSHATLGLLTRVREPVRPYASR